MERQGRRGSGKLWVSTWSRASGVSHVCCCHQVGEARGSETGAGLGLMDGHHMDREERARALRSGDPCRSLTKGYVPSASPGL